MPEDKQSIIDFISEHWGSNLCVSRGKLYDVSLLPGFISKTDAEIHGLITYRIEKNECEITTLNSVAEKKGLGTQLINKVIESAKQNNCNRVWLITTNDNSHAIRFYQKRGFEWCAFHKDAMLLSRKLKPQIPLAGMDNITIKHEIEFELILDKE